MAINLLAIEPHKVSTDLSGYITYIYGPPKTGKTTLATQMPKSLLLAFERGYNALPGVMVQDITSWGEFKQVYKELKKPEVKAAFDAIIIDTIDIAADFCQTYICKQKDIEALGDLGYGKGWTAFKEEFQNTFRALSQLGYAVFFIGHHKEAMVTDDNTGAERMIIRPALGNSTRGVIEGMADIYGYAHQVRGKDMSVLTLRSPDDSITCGGRFKYIPNEITMSYDNLIEAVKMAIEKEAAETGGQFVTNEKNVYTEVSTVSIEEARAAFETVIAELSQRDNFTSFWTPRIVSLTDSYLGKGKKVNQCTPSQAEHVMLIVGELKELMAQNN